MGRVVPNVHCVGDILHEESELLKDEGEGPEKVPFGWLVYTPPWRKQICSKGSEKVPKSMVNASSHG